MTFPIYQVDAFADALFQGNPAAVCPLHDWLADDVMQKLAAENNLSETAFFVKENDQYHIRWFTPEFEINLCGHATLASAYVIFNFIEPAVNDITFTSQSGPLKVYRNQDLIQMDFPSWMPAEAPAVEDLIKGLSIAPQKIYKGRDYLLVYNNEEEIKNIIPNFHFLNALDAIGIIVTAKGDAVDFVSRFFVPNSVIGEDPVTGSAHSSLIPYWSKVLGKTTMTARQLSKRSGTLYCEAKGDRVLMAGKGVLYLKGEYYM